MNNRTILLSVTYLGPIQYFSKFILFNDILIERTENYIKQTYRNRCIIYGSNGKLILSIPVLKGDEYKTLIADVRIDYTKKWQKLHWKGIESAYRSSPFYEFYSDRLHGFYSKPYKFLFDYNIEILYRILDILDIKNEIRYTDDFIPASKTDLADMRDKIHPKKGFYTDRNFNPEYYNQVFIDKHGFMPNLSIIDLIFNQGPDAISLLKKSIKPDL